MCRHNFIVRQIWDYVALLSFSSWRHKQYNDCYRDGKKQSTLHNTLDTKHFRAFQATKQGQTKGKIQIRDKTYRRQNRSETKHIERQRMLETKHLRDKTYKRQNTLETKHIGDKPH